MEVKKIICDNIDKCQCGKTFYKCSNGHDICSLCMVHRHNKIYCPICLKDAELK